MANEFWEYKLPAGFQKPSESASNEVVGKFIADKYVKRLYVPKNAIDPVHEYFEGKRNPEPVPQQISLPKRPQQPTNLPKTQQSVVFKQPVQKPSEPIKPSIQKADLLDFDFSSDVPARNVPVQNLIPQRPLEAPLKPVCCTSTYEDPKRKFSAPVAAPPLDQPAPKPQNSPIAPTQFFSSPPPNMYLPYTNPMFYAYSFYTQPMMPYPNACVPQNMPVPEQPQAAPTQKIPPSKLAQLKQSSGKSPNMASKKL